jgi:hypothetical protein
LRVSRSIYVRHRYLEAADFPLGTAAFVFLGGFRPGNAPSERQFEARQLVAYRHQRVEHRVPVEILQVT